MTRSRSFSGFTLVETIVAVVLIGIVASLIIGFVGPRLTESPRTLLRARNEALTEQALERVQSDYLQAVNSADPDSALSTIVTNEAAGKYDQNGVNVDVAYINFSAAGAEQPSLAPTNTLKVTAFVVENGNSLHRVTTLLTASRITGGSFPAVEF
ncbi:MAG: type II secretion system protein [Desulfovibrionaceae bacterium]